MEERNILPRLSRNMFEFPACFDVLILWSFLVGCDFEMTRLSTAEVGAAPENLAAAAKKFLLNANRSYKGILLFGAWLSLLYADCCDRDCFIKQLLLVEDVVLSIEIQDFDTTWFVRENCIGGQGRCNMSQRRRYLYKRITEPPEGLMLLVRGGESEGSE